MVYEKNMSGWRKALADIGVELKYNFQESNRIKEIKTLLKSGLPTYQYHDFLEKDLEIKKFYEKYGNQVVVRAVPTDKKFQRYTFIGEPFRTTKENLKEKIQESERKNYQVIVNEYDPAEYCGVIISNKEGLVIDLVKEPNLENLCHGHVIPWSAEFKQKYPYSFKRMYFSNIKDDQRNNQINDQVKKLMWSVIKSISKFSLSDGGIPYFEPKKGYFEFVFSKKNGKLKFIDYRKR